MAEEYKYKYATDVKKLRFNGLLDRAFFFIYGNTSPVTDLFIAAGQSVVHGGFAGIRIACKSNSHG